VGGRHTGARSNGNLAFIRHHALRLANVVVLAILGALLYRQVDVRELRTAIGHADVRLVAAALALDVPIAVLFVLRSHFVLVRLGYRVEARVLVPAIILGNVAGSLTPASTGELLRATALRGHAKVATADGVALVLFERGVSVYLMALTTGVAAAFVTLSSGRALAVAVASVPLLAAPAFAPLLLRRLPAPSNGTRTSLAARAFGHVSDAADRLSWILEDRGLLAIWSLITVLILTMSMLQVWLLARSISDVVNPAQAWVAFGGSQLAGIASLLPLGVGALDGSLAAILRKFGLTFEQGAGTAVLLRLVVTIPYGITAIVCYLYLQHLGASRKRAPGDASR
jgi:uncharacterized membrane protein YbhN (UPF0104 family)